MVDRLTEKNKPEELRALIDSLREDLRLILSSTEELKTAMGPIVRADEPNRKLLELHTSRIAKLVERVYGTEQEHKEQAKKLDLISQKETRLEQAWKDHDADHDLLEQRLAFVEYQQLEGIENKIRKGEILSKSELSTLDGFVKLHPADSYLLSLKARSIALKSGKDEAIKWIDNLIQKNDDPMLWWTKGLIVGRSEGSLKLFDKTLELLGDKKAKWLRHQAYYCKSSVLEGLDRFDEALAAADKAIEYSPKCSNAWTVKGDSLRQLNRIPEALGCYDKALQLNDESAWAWRGKGTALAILGPAQYDEAIKCFDRSIQLEPNVALAYFRKTDVLMGKRSYDEALKVIEKALELDPKDACGWCHKGVILTNLKEPQKAIGAFDRCIEIGSPEECVVMLLYRSTAMENAGRAPEAYAWLSKLDPQKFKTAEQLNGYSWALYRVGQFSKGIEFANKAIGIDSQTAEYWDTLACNLSGAKSDSEALATFQKAVGIATSADQISWDEYDAVSKRLGLGNETEMAREKLRRRGSST